MTRGVLVSALGHLGEIEEAHPVWRELMAINPKYSLAERLDRRLAFKNPADRERLLDGLGKANLLDWN
jgi:adenylate cyclase